VLLLAAMAIHILCLLHKHMSEDPTLMRKQYLDCHSGSFTVCRDSRDVAGHDSQNTRPVGEQSESSERKAECFLAAMAR
jgi:hypothetical protein